MLVLEGQIDASCTLVEQVTGLRGEVVLDLAGVDFINSLGVRVWVRTLAALREAGASVVLRRCSQEMVLQLNMIPEAGAPVSSFYAPMICGGCGAGSSECIEVADHTAQLSRGEMPSLRCRECGAALTLDELPEEYLSFLVAG